MVVGPLRWDSAAGGGWGALLGYKRRSDSSRSYR